MVPFARRGSLRVAFRGKLAELAKQLGRPKEELERDFVRGNKELAPAFASVVADSVDSIVSSKLEKRIGQLEKQVEDLKRKQP
jgi:hypothetical protein